MILALLGLALAGPPPLVQHPLPWDDERTRLTVAYLQAHHGEPLPADPTTMAPRVIVLHWTGGGSAEGAWQTFAPTRLAGRPELQDAGAVNVSAHFLVHRDGTIEQLLPVTRVGRHAIGLNHTAIGIENVGDGDRWPLTDAQVAANVALVRWLAEEHPITHLLGHHETNRLDGQPLFREQDPDYRTVKQDPGDAFMARVRAEVAELGLQGPP